MKDLVRRFTSRKLLVTVAAAAAPWLAPDTNINGYVKLGITSVLAALYTCFEFRLDRKGVDLKIEEAALQADHSHPDAASVGSVNAALKEIQNRFEASLAEARREAIVSRLTNPDGSPKEDPALD